MKIKKQSEHNPLFLILSFILPVFAMCIMMLIRGFIPFGKVSMLYSDMYHQYYPFFISFRKALLSGENLLYSWDVGMGMDYLGLISYYLASPLNLLSILVPENATLEYFSMLSPLKMGFAGLFFAIFLQKLFNKNDFSITVFGCFYALCAWSLGYQWNVMWMDTFALLPLVALGAICLLQDKKVLLYTICLFLSIFANYYIGFFVCIFIVLLFLCYEICRWDGFEKFFTDLGRILLFSVLAVGMTAVLELPAYTALQTTQSSVNQFPKKFELNIASENTRKGLFDAMRQVAGNMNGNIVPTFKEGLPNIYCGLAANILAILFLTCKQVKIRDKICSIFLLTFFNVSFILRQLDYIWHGFHFTNMIPYRFSFLYSFVLLYMAYRAYLLRHSFKLWQILIAIPPAVGLMFCIEKPGKTYWLFNSIFLLFYFIALLLPYLFREKAPLSDETDKPGKRTYVYNYRVGSLALICIMLLELGLNVLNFGIYFVGTTVSNYPMGTKYSASMIRYMKEREKNTPFYRAEVTHTQTLNDGALNDYHGISTFTSSANVQVTEFMEALGYGAYKTYNRYCYEESSPVANLFLNIKYMLDRQGNLAENNYFTDVHSYGNVHLLENNAYLPLGFMTKNQILGVDFPKATGNAFHFQNKLLKAATGINEDAWTLMTGQTLSITGKDVTVRTQTPNGYCTYATANSGGTLIYSYTADREGFVCVDLDLPQRNTFSVWINGRQLYTDTYSLPQSLSVSQVVPGDIVEVHLSCRGGETGSAYIHCGVLNASVFQKAYNILNESTLQLTEFSNTEIKGTVVCKEAGVLYTSIPQDGNWVATVDGKPVDTALIGDAMVALILTEGEHEICFRYENKAFIWGLRISVVCLIIFFIVYQAFYAEVKKKDNKPNEQEKAGS